MRNVLFIVYLYPPLNCGVCRPSKIAKYLPAYGWNPVILTVKKSRIRPLYDESLMRDIPSETTVYRTSSFESTILMRHLPRFLNISHLYVQIPDPFVGWLPFAVKKGLEIIEKENIDAIFSSSMPTTSHLVALTLKKLTGLPWLADFRDEWTLNPFITYPKIPLKIGNKLEAAVMKNTDAMTTINDSIRKSFAVKYPDYARKFSTITHGFDPEDFSTIQRKPHNTFTIVYAGSFYGRRSPEPFLTAVKGLIEEDKDLKDHMRIHFVGGVQHLQKMVDQFGLHDVVSLSGYITHEEVFSSMVNADVLLLIIGSGTAEDRISTGKLFEYMGSGTPILAVIPEGAAADVIRSADLGVVANPQDVEGIKKAIWHLYEKYRKGESHQPKKQVIAEYDVKRLSKKFSEILDKIVDQKGLQP